MGGNPLGRRTGVPLRYSPEILHPIPRERIPVDGAVMHGLDHWRAYELSWLDGNGRPEVFVGEFLFPADSPFLVESKSLKLYLAGLNSEQIEDAASAAERISRDLSACCGGKAEARIWGLTAYPDNCLLADYALIDKHPVARIEDGPDAGLLTTGDGQVVDRKLRSELFRSICPVTGPPDWASAALAYSGREISEPGLLRYFCAYRSHAAWHESCAGQAFHDILKACQPEQLSLSLHFLRRGGLEINVYRSTAPINPNELIGRDARQ